jgi:hypothetical protein
MVNLGAIAVPLIKSVIAVISLPIAGGLTAKCAASIDQSSPGNKKAHKFATIATIICWVAFALIIIGILLLFFSGAGEAEVASSEMEVEQSLATGGKKGNLLFTLLDWMCILLIGATGVLMILTAVNLDTHAVGQANHTAWAYATGLAAGLFGLLGLYLLIKFIAFMISRRKRQVLKQRQFNYQVEQAYAQIQLAGQHIAQENSSSQISNQTLTSYSPSQVADQYQPLQTINQ